MFLGEFSCLVAFYLLMCRDRRRAEPILATAQPFNPLLFLPPALCDMTGTSIMYVGTCRALACGWGLCAVVVAGGLIRDCVYGGSWIGVSPETCPVSQGCFELQGLQNSALKKGN